MSIMQPENVQALIQWSEQLPMSKEAFMAKWNKLSPRAQQELLDLAREREEERLEQEQIASSKPAK
jgi:hypothetical protein